MLSSSRVAWTFCTLTSKLKSVEDSSNQKVLSLSCLDHPVRGSRLFQQATNALDNSAGSNTAIDRLWSGEVKARLAKD